MAVISSTSPVIILAKIGRLSMIKSLYNELVISPSVKMEVVDRGKELGAKDALEIEDAIKEGWIKVAKLSKKQGEQAKELVDETKVGLGEAEALVLARDRRALVILDDKEARAIAKSWKLEYTSTVTVLYEAFFKRLMSFDELIEDLSKTAKIMWISTDVITEIIKRAEKVRR